VKFNNSRDMHKLMRKGRLLCHGMCVQHLGTVVRPIVYAIKCKRFRGLLKDWMHSMSADVNGKRRGKKTKKIERLAQTRSHRAEGSGGRVESSQPRTKSMQGRVERREQKQQRESRESREQSENRIDKADSSTKSKGPVHRYWSDVTPHTRRWIYP
jgi:hypothetical protein